MARQSIAGPLVVLTSVASLLIACGDSRSDDMGHGNPGGATTIANESEIRIGPDEAIIIPADDVAWRPGPPSLETGAQVAALEGDSANRELFTIRLRLPDGFRIMPHTHPGFERVTVLSGTFHLGHGTEFDESAARRLSAGSYVTMPPNMEHYAWAEGETIVQLTSIGPWEIDYVNPDDDPRRR